MKALQRGINLLDPQPLPLPFPASHTAEVYDKELDDEFEWINMQTHAH